MRVMKQYHKKYKPSEKEKTRIRNQSVDMQLCYQESWLYKDEQFTKFKWQQNTTRVHLESDEDDEESPNLE